MTPFEQATKLAQSLGKDKCKTWKRGFRMGWLGMSGSTIIGEKVTVNEAERFAEGYAAGKSVWSAHKMQGPELAEWSDDQSPEMVFPFDGVHIEKTLRSLRESAKRIVMALSIAAHDRAVAEYHEHVARRESAA